MATQVVHAKWFMKIGDSPEEFFTENNVRMIFPQEFEALLHYNGFRIESKYGLFDKTPFDSSSSRQIMVCQMR